MNGEAGGCGGGDVVVAIAVVALVACGVAACVCVRPNNANNVCCNGNVKGLHTRWR